MEPIIKQVKEIKFSLFSPEQIKRLGAAKIVTPELYDMDGYPVDGGIMDLRLGTISPGIRCRTCGGTLKECLGHFGYIELARPAIHIKFLPLIELCLKSTCNECNRILLNEEDIKLKKISKAKTSKKCPYCNTKQEKIKLEKPSSFYMGKQRIFPTDIRERLARISDKDLEVLGVNPKSCRPEWALLTLFLVPSVTVRASITLETGERSEDDLTHKLSDIVRANQRLWENLNAGAPEVIIEDLWDLLQYHITTFFDNSIASVPPARHRSGHPLKTITERIKGKEGRIRHNLTGKRVNFSSRTVISPDPYIKLNEIGIPIEVAKVLTVPERVTSSNIEMLKEMMKKEDYPKIINIVRPDGKRKRISEDLKEQMIEELDIGYVVERNIKDGDFVLFNRHPTLHRMSIMGHYVKVIPGRTFRINPLTTFPYNADFDGDEMNIHAPQTEEARAEAKVLLDVDEHLISPKINSNIFGCIEDSITGLYLLTLKEDIGRDFAVQLIVESGGDPSKLPSRESVSGRDIFSALLPSKVNFEGKNKTCNGQECPHFDRCKKEECPYHGYTLIKNGKLVRGIIDDLIIGVEQNTLIREMDKQAGRKETMEFLKKVFLLSSLYLTRHGFTISPADIKTTAETKNESYTIVAENEKKVQKIIESYYDSSLEIIPGKTPEETREIKILQTLNEVRAKVGEVIKKRLEKNNPAYIMMMSGSGGNLLFLTQMASVIGQQSLWGKRINIGYAGRTLSLYKEYDLSARAGGFIYSNYLDGLKTDEFFFTAITGRDSLMDTGLRTPKSGYLYRRLVNALQDLRVEYDSTIRDSNSNIIQFIYGENGIDITREHLPDNKIAPGEAIGVITAQSIGQPSTQMTLNVFHFAGVSEMQVTIGLPRLIEIFDARKELKTPAMEIHFEKEFNNEEDAKKITAKIKEVKIREIAREISVDFNNAKINIQLDKDSLKEFHLNVDKVAEAIKSKNINIKKGDDSVTINAGENDFKELFKLKEKLKDMHISGIKGIKQILLTKRENNYVVLTAGSNLDEVFKIKGVDKRKTTTNNFHEIANVLGIEAARQSIIEESKKTIEKQGLEINDNHIKLVADAMTASGDIKGITRVGIIQDKSSILARASFETPIKHFVNASIIHASDHLTSVVENLILNQPVPIGTGLPGLLVKIINQEALARK